MRKIILLSIFIIGFVSCTPKQIKESLVTSNRKELIGIWWDAKDKAAPNATFMITDSAIIYPDQDGKADFKYQIRNDSMIIFFEGFNSTSKIEKLTKDTLILITNSDKLVLYKPNEQQ